MTVGCVVLSERVSYPPAPQAVGISIIQKGNSHIEPKTSKHAITVQES